MKRQVHEERIAVHLPILHASESRNIHGLHVLLGHDDMTRHPRSGSSWIEIWPFFHERWKRHTRDRCPGCNLNAFPDDMLRRDGKKLLVMGKLFDRIPCPELGIHPPRNTCANEK